MLEIRGDLTEAEEAYARAARYGHEPQPGLALLWLAQGRTSAAVAAVHRLTAEPRPDVLRVALLTAAIEILLAADAVADAATLSRDLDQCAALLGTPLVRGRAGHATGAVLLAQGQADQALPRGPAGDHRLRGSGGRVRGRVQPDAALPGVRRPGRPGLGHP